MDGAEGVAQTGVTADTILQGFKKLNDGVIEFTLPIGTTVWQAGKLLNDAFRARGADSAVFNDTEERNAWSKNELNQDLQTEPGHTYRFKITTNPAEIPLDDLRQVRYGAPLGAIALPEACSLLTDGRSFFRDEDGDKFRISGSTPGVKLESHRFCGVSLNLTDANEPIGAFAKLVSPGN